MSYHNKRLNRTIEENFGINSSIDLADVVDADKEGQRCKVIYGKSIQSIIYQPIVGRSFKSFKIVEADIEYQYKYLDRRGIDTLIANRGDCDDIIIVSDGLVRDTSIANIAYFDGTQWITPAKPILPGTMRASLIDRGKIIEGEVSVADLLDAKKLAIMNAVVGFDTIDNFEIIEATHHIVSG